MTLKLDRSTWQRVVFGDVIDSVTDRVDIPSDAGVDRYVGLEHLDSGVMSVQRWDSPDIVEAQKLRFQPNDVIFGRRRAYLKKVALAEFEGICSAHALVLRPKPDSVDPEFLPVFLSSDAFLDRAVEISVGSLSPTVNWRDLKVQTFNLPPLGEQRRIADLMWKVERHAQSCRDLSASLTQATLDLLALTFNDAHQRGDVRALADILTLSNSVERVDPDRKYRIAGVLNQGQGLIDKGTVLGREIAYSRLTRLEAGQVVMRKLTAWEGPIQVVPAEFDGFFVSSEFPTFAVNTSIVSLDCLRMLFSWPGMWALMKARVQGTVQRRMRLSPAQLLEVQVRIPPQELQARMVGVWRASGQGQQALTSELSSLNTLRYSLSTEIFGGLR